MSYSSMIANFKKIGDVMEKELKDYVFSSLVNVTTKTMRNIEKDVKETYKGYINERYRYDPDIYIRNYNFYDGLNVKIRSGHVYGHEYIQDIKFSIDSSRFHGEYELNDKWPTSPEDIVDLVIDGTRTPIYKGGKDFGEHVVTYTTIKSDKFFKIQEDATLATILDKYEDEFKSNVREKMVQALNDKIGLER